MSLWRRLRVQLCSTNSIASQSSNSGCVGRSPRKPKSLAVATMPLPKWCCQSRLTITRAVSGLSFDAIQFASASRRPVLLGTGSIVASAALPPGETIVGKPGKTSSPRLASKPRSSRNVFGGGPDLSVSPIATGGGGGL